MTKKIVVAERDNIAAVLEDGKVTDFFIHKGDVLLGDVYLALVDNILPSIDAAFVNVGCDKMGFLHASDVMGKGGLNDKLSPKQKLIVQVVKEPTGHKGPRVTTAISLPGRFLVLMPHETGINISRKISSAKERARLKSVLNLIKPTGVGVIVRTEAEGQSEADIQEDLELLLEKWSQIVTAAESHNPPNLLYRDQDLLYRVIREACTEDTAEILVDTTFAMHRAQQLLQNWNMKKDIEVTVYKGTDPLLNSSGIAKEIRLALQTKVNLPSGGYLYIQTTEALTVIDVNSGKFTSSATQDETILKTNIEAIKEIARQLRLRNIGGMIIIDFIDMLSRVDKLAVMEELELALEPDKSKPQVGQLSDLGLVELTRHRQGQSLSEIFTKKCQHCQGTGVVVQDFNFASASQEGDQKAKASKMKLNPGQMRNKHKSDKQNLSFNSNKQRVRDFGKRKPRQNQPLVEQTAVQAEQTTPMETPENKGIEVAKLTPEIKKQINQGDEKDLFTLINEMKDAPTSFEEGKVEQTGENKPEQKTEKRMQRRRTTANKPKEEQQNVENQNAQVEEESSDKPKPKRGRRKKVEKEAE